MKAAEIRTAAEAFADGSAREPLLHSAAAYDTLADRAEQRLRAPKQGSAGAGKP